jgi:hypothetical protein
MPAALPRGDAGRRAKAASQCGAAQSSQPGPAERAEQLSVLAKPQAGVSPRGTPWLGWRSAMQVKSAPFRRTRVRRGARPVSTGGALHVSSCSPRCSCHGEDLPLVVESSRGDRAAAAEPEPCPDTRPRGSPRRSYLREAGERTLRRTSDHLGLGSVRGSCLSLHSVAYLALLSGAMSLTVFEVSLRQSEGPAAFAPDTGARRHLHASRRWQACPVPRPRPCGPWLSSAVLRLCMRVQSAAMRTNVPSWAHRVL